MTHSSSLSGLKVLDFSQNLPGPYASFLLASMGADVVKVEPPHGDPGRHIGPFFSMINRGKRSVVLDLRDESQQKNLKALIRWADVLIEGFRPGVMGRLGGDYATAIKLNPLLVYCSISAFGQRGPRAQQPGHDLNLQALAGVCDLERDEHGTPRGAALPIADLSSSLVAVASICAALLERHKTQRGQHLDVAMSDAVLSWSSIWGEGVNLAEIARAEIKKSPARPLLMRLSKGLLETLKRRRLYAMPHYGVFRTKDRRHVALGVVDERHFWLRLCEVLGMERFKNLSMSARSALSGVLSPIVRRRVRRRDHDELLAALEAADVPATSVLSVKKLADEPQFQARGLFDATRHPRAPLPHSVHLPPNAPGLGEHTAEVLDALSLGPSSEK